MRQALEDLIEAVETAINAGDWKVDGACDPTLVLIRAKEALAQPDPYAKGYADAMNWKVQNHLEHLPTAQSEQEPVGKFAKFTDGIWREVTDGSAGMPLYTTPPQRKPLTLVELSHIFASIPSIPFDGEWQLELSRAIEAAHGIKE